MPNLTVSQVIDTFMQSATQADARAAIGMSSIVGSSGTSGTSSSSGTSGTSGTSGETGSSGSSGSSGSTGSSGSSGETGSSGSSGTTGTSGVSGISGGAIYYFNNSITQSPYKEFSTIPTGQSETTASLLLTSGSTGIIQSYQTPEGSPNVTVLPPGIWSFFLHASKTHTSSSFQISADVYARSITNNESYLFSTDPDDVTSTETLQYLSDAYQSGNSLTTTDRIVVKIVAKNTSNVTDTITFYSEDHLHYSYGQTTFGVLDVKKSLNDILLTRFN